MQNKQEQQQICNNPYFMNIVKIILRLQLYMCTLHNTLTGEIFYTKVLWLIKRYSRTDK